MTGDTVGGVWTFALELAEGLGERDVEIILATMGGEPSDAQRAEAAAISNLRLLPSAYKLEWMEDPWEDVEASGAWLMDLERRFSPDVIHLNSYGHGSLPWQAPVLLTAHSCVLSWWAGVKRTPVPPEWRRYRRSVAATLAGADLLTAPSTAMLRNMWRYETVLPPSRIVPNGRNAAKYRASAKQPFILAAGRLWDEAKNTAALARIAARLQWPVYLAGDDRSRSGAAADLRGCRTLGRLSAAELSDWYARAGIYALPARYEPFGLSALEAALSGCALVLGDIESLREIWQDAAVFVDPDDDTALEAALRDLIRNDEWREGMAQRASARARYFPASRMTASYYDVYVSLVESRRSVCVS